VHHFAPASTTFGNGAAYLGGRGRALLVLRWVNGNNDEGGVIESIWGIREGFTIGKTKLRQGGKGRAPLEKGNLLRAMGRGGGEPYV